MSTTYEALFKLSENGLIKKKTFKLFCKVSPWTFHSMCSADRVTLLLRPSLKSYRVKAKTLNEHIRSCPHPLALAGPKHSCTVWFSKHNRLSAASQDSVPSHFPNLYTHSSSCLTYPPQLVCLGNFLFLKMQASDPAFPFLSTYQGLEAGIRRYRCTTMLIAALFTITKRWKQPKGPSAEDCVNKM